MIRLFVMALALAAGASQAVAQAPAQQQQQQRPAPRTYTQDQLWSRSDGRISFTPARISLALRAGPVSFLETGEVGMPGRGLDNVMQYRTEDGQVFASVYFYLPPLAHAGLSAFTTEQGLGTLSGGRLRRVAAGTAAVGGVADGAVRIDYRGYRETLASSAAFFKAGRWMVKLRVSGPEDRRADVEAAMTALIASFRFEGEIRPRPAVLLDVAGCASAPTTAARALPDNQDTFTDSLLAVFDPAGEMTQRPGASNPAPILARFGNSWCQSTRGRIGDNTIPILRATGPAPSGTGRVNAQTVAVALISDSGRLLEVVRSEENRFTLFHHQIGETLVLGAYAAPPTDEQIIAMLTGADREAGRIRARIGLGLDGSTEIELRSIPGLTDRPTT
ncbi:MAG TPA: hypothetical protein VMS43_17675 [Allosphingosinicella sp.]|nr:hypothetical protein [Allosphingosinicella sp.]